MTEDGGYYAIKGFEYQIDKTILELLNSKNTPINIEQIEDIDTDNRVIQVKYKETAKLVPSEVNEPISKLIEKFKKDSSKKYILYAYFIGSNGYKQYINDFNQVKLEGLNKFLGNKKNNFSDKEKELFIKSFEIDLSSSFAQQFESTISKLKEEDFIGNTDTEAIFYYSNIANYLRKLVCHNPTDQLEKRTCTKEEVFQYLKRGRCLIFNSAFREHQGEQKYFNFIKKKYFMSLNIDNFERFIIIELSGLEIFSEIKETVLKIKNRFYKKAGSLGNAMIKSGAPYIYLRNISEQFLAQIKKELSNEKFIFKDGHDFLNADFSLTSIKISSTSENRICLKFINLEENFFKLIQSEFNKHREVYQFYIDQPILIQEDVKNITIKVRNISDINSII